MANFLLVVVSTGSTTEELVIEVLEMTADGFFVACGFDKLNHRSFCSTTEVFVTSEKTWAYRTLKSVRKQGA